MKTLWPKKDGREIGKSDQKLASEITNGDVKVN